MGRNHLIPKIIVHCKDIITSEIKDKKLGAVRIVQCRQGISILGLINHVRCVATENHLLQK